MEVEARLEGELVKECALQGPRALECAVQATVCAPGADAEAGVVGQEQWNAVRARVAQGHSVSQIARDLDLDRKTVRRCLRQKAWRPYKRGVAVPTVLDRHRAWLLERAPQVHYSARILWQELRANHGYGGSYETVKLAVRPLRAQAAVASLTQRRFETSPGEQAQVDWGQARVVLGGQSTKVHIFVMTLGYSRRGYAEGYLNERMANLLAAHEHAFAHFGGRCESLLYDRMRTVVLGTGEDQRPRLNTTFAAFASHWGFSARLCQPYRARTKGKVESGVKYVKRNFLPGRAFRDLEDFNDQLAAWQLEVADLRIHGTTHERPIDRFAREVEALIPTLRQPSFLQAMVRERIVAGDWLVSIDGNRYSVPFGLIGRTVQVVREAEQYVIRHRGQVVAEHPVLSGRAHLSVRPEHGPGAAARNVRKRFGGLRTGQASGLEHGREVEVRDLALYDHLFTFAQPEVV